MPVYEYTCARGHRTEDYVLSWRERRDEVECKSCGDIAAYVPSTFAIDFSSPRHKALLHNQGRIPWEPGLDQEIERNGKDRKKKLKKKISDGVRDIVQDAHTLTITSTSK